MADVVDFGEMFHNFLMDPQIRKYAGVDVDSVAKHLSLPGGNSPTTDSKNKAQVFVRWNRLFMGMRPSPYNAVRYYYWGEEFARGNRANSSNPMGYDQVRLNLPGMEAYDPSLPKVMKWNSRLNNLAGDAVTFVDDVRLTGSSKENCHAVHRQFVSRMQYLGMLDAPRKFRPPSQLSAGAWTGTIFKVSTVSISKTVSSEKWEKGKSLINQLASLLLSSSDLSDSPPLLNRKELERTTGYLNHLSMTFEDIVPFLKGFYLTLNSWRPKRDVDGWKVSDKLWLQYVTDRHERGFISEEELDQALHADDMEDAPPKVKSCTRFPDDVNILRQFFDLSDPPVVTLRSKSIISVVYGF